MTIELKSAALTTATARLKLKASKVHFVNVAVGLALGYRRSDVALNKSGSWWVRWATGGGDSKRRAFATADDYLPADGADVLTYEQAFARARDYARHDGDESKIPAVNPLTVAQAIQAYAVNLQQRGKRSTNATQPHHHLARYQVAVLDGGYDGVNLLDKAVADTTQRDWTQFKHWLVANAGMTGAAIVRMFKSLKAALNLAAENDARITNTDTWRSGLDDVAMTSNTARHSTFKPAEADEIVRAAYAKGERFGLYIHAHTTGQRSSQLAELNVEHFNDDNADDPCLEILASAKGTGANGKAKQRNRILVPIPQSLALKLRAHIAGRRGNQPLLLNDAGERWGSKQAPHRHAFPQLMRELGFGKGPTIYTFRHTAITMQVKAGIDLLSIAENFDTSVQVIRDHYAKRILDHTRKQIRAASLDVQLVPVTDNVVAIRG